MVAHPAGGHPAMAGPLQYPAWFRVGRVRGKLNIRKTEMHVKKEMPAAVFQTALPYIECRAALNSMWFRAQSAFRTHSPRVLFFSLPIPQSAIRNPQSKGFMGFSFRIPHSEFRICQGLCFLQSAIRNPQSAIGWGACFFPLFLLILLSFPPKK